MTLTTPSPISDQAGAAIGEHAQLSDKRILEIAGHWFDVDASGWRNVIESAREIIAAALSTAPTTVISDQAAGDRETLKERLTEAIAEALGGALDCTRTWSAWSVGTMSDRDFVEVRDDADRLGEIAEAALSTLSTKLPNETPTAWVLKMADGRIDLTDAEYPPTDALQAWANKNCHKYFSVDGITYAKLQEIFK